MTTYVLVEIDDPAEADALVDACNLGQPLATISGHQVHARAPYKGLVNPLGDDECDGADVARRYEESER